MINSLTVAIIYTVNKLLEVSPSFSFTKTPMVYLHRYYLHHIFNTRKRTDKTHDRSLMKKHLSILRLELLTILSNNSPPVMNSNMI
ncbi:hypothetical protein MtrunA17_Chr5g0428041 [Medicago truncatula]|uniref:Uncharacterized protein n=1 Tax=Medicago truncatula TaxID=3880 RepID=A0A396I047_MEDTR|nr:hypothetical protein MtrunA17_Chr5g0428041 [Medicago truncatula]